MKLSPWVQRTAVFLAILSLWPVILRRQYPAFQHRFWEVLMYVMLGVMLVLFVVNVIRFRRMRRDGGGNGQVL